jgi:hypothetical protein
MASPARVANAAPSDHLASAHSPTRSTRPICVRVAAGLCGSVGSNASKRRVAAGRPDSSKSTRRVAEASRKDDRNMSKELSQLPNSLESKTMARISGCSRSRSAVRASDPSLRTHQSPSKDTIKVSARTEACQPGRLGECLDGPAFGSGLGARLMSVLIADEDMASMGHCCGWTAPSQGTSHAKSAGQSIAQWYRSTRWYRQTAR